jgi:glycosyltransferase involved in cell wall biosynthesis
VVSKNLPLVSIIIPTKNEEKNIGRCLKAILDQTYPKEKLEIIIVDNFSQDKTAKIAKKFPIRFFQKGPERHAQRNFGVAKSHGKYLVFIDADMKLEKELVEEAVKKCEKEGYDALILPERGAGKGFWARCQALEKECYLGDALMETPNRLIKREVYQRVRGYDRGLIAGEDFDLGDRIIDAGFKVGRTTSFINHYETTSLWLLLKKKYYYGKEMPKYFKKSGAIGVKRFSLFRLAYFRNWRLFIKDPTHGLGMILMKTSQWLAGGIGYLVGLLKNRININLI